MAEVTMTVHEALSRKVLLEKQLQSPSRVDFYGIRQGARMEHTSDTPQQFAAKAQASWQSVRAKIENLKRIRAAIVQSNAVTTVVVAGQRMTVAAAIEYRRSSIKIERQVLQLLSVQFDTRSKQLVQFRKQLVADAERAATQILGAQASKDSPEFASVIAQYTSGREWATVDPIEIERVIAEMTTRLDEFETTVDNILTASNVATLVTVDLVD